MTGRCTMKKTRYTRSRFRWKMEIAIFALICGFADRRAGVDAGTESRDVWYVCQKEQWRAGRVRGCLPSSPPVSAAPPFYHDTVGLRIQKCFTSSMNPTLAKLRCFSNATSGPFVAHSAPLSHIWVAQRCSSSTASKYYRLAYIARVI
jgi:hypothetical protein